MIRLSKGTANLLLQNKAATFLLTSLVVLCIGIAEYGKSRIEKEVVVELPVPKESLPKNGKNKRIGKKDVCRASTDCRLLAEAAYHEARGESDEGVAGVMHVILNRAYSPHYPHTVSEVLHQHKQFSYLWDGSVERGMKDKKQVDRMLRIGYNVIVGEEKDPTNGATHYHTKSVKPVWRTKLKRTVVINSHIFYKGY